MQINLQDSCQSGVGSTRSLGWATNFTIDI